MSDEISDIKLALLEMNPDVQLQKITKSCFLVSYGSRYWKFYPNTRSWIECDGDGMRTGIKHYGPISAFYEKEIAQSKNWPKNHFKEWKSSELELLLKFANSDLTVSEVAKILERSNWSIIMKLGKEVGMPLDHLSSRASLDCLVMKDIWSNNG